MTAIVKGVSVFGHRVAQANDNKPLPIDKRYPFFLPLPRELMSAVLLKKAGAKEYVFEAGGARFNSELERSRVSRALRL